MDTVFNEDYGMYLRPAEWDANIAAEQRHYKPMNIDKNSIVCDIGAHIGSFALWAFRQGAKKVVSFEPEADNYRVLMQNQLKWDKFYWCTTRAAVGPEYGWEQLNIHPGNTGMHSLIPSLKEFAGLQTVLTLPLDQILSSARFTHLKVDIEGAELELKWNTLKYSSIRYVAVEYHLVKMSKDQANWLHSIFQYLKFSCPKPPDFTHAHQTLGIYHR